MPSMSFGPMPASFIALSAASACSPIWDKFGMRPSSVVSAAPTIAMDFGFIGSALPAAQHPFLGRGQRGCQARASPRRAEQGQRYLAVELLERDLERHVEDERLRRLRAIDDVGHHPRPLI